MEDGIVTNKPIMVTDGKVTGFSSGITLGNVNAVGSNDIGVSMGVQNRSAAGTAWSALVVEADNGTDLANFCNVYINSSGYNDSNYTIGGANAGGIFINGGNLLVGTQTADKDVVIHAGGTLAANEIVRFKDSDKSMKIYDNGTATATAGAATLAKVAGKITSESLTTAAGATYTLTLTNSRIAATDLVFVSLAMGTATTGTPVVTTVKPNAGSVVVVIQNIHASAALNGTIILSYWTVKTA